KPCAACRVDGVCMGCTMLELDTTPSNVITKDGTYVVPIAGGHTNVLDVITYIFTVENTGNVTLTDITVTDANAVVSGGPLASLADRKSVGSGKVVVRGVCLMGMESGADDQQSAVEG